VDAKNLMQTSATFCEVFALKMYFFSFCPQSCSASFGRASSLLLSFASPPIFIVLPICERISR